MQNKICTKCKKELLANNDYFRKQKGGKFGLRPECKECGTKKDKKYYQENKKKWVDYQIKNAEKIKEKNKKWKENNKGRVKEYNKENYWGNREANIERKKKWHVENTDHIKSYRREYRKKNREYILQRQSLLNKTETIKASQRQWRKENKDKVNYYNQKRRNLKANLISEFTYEDWEECLKFFNHKDAYTGEKMKRVSQDHIIPISKGGGYLKNNIVPCEGSVNSSKSNKELMKWYIKKPFFSGDRLKKINEWINKDA